MTGGGTVTIKNVGGTIRVRWDTRILAVPLMGHATSTFYVIDCPAAGATLGAGSVDADGINLGTNTTGATGYASLWYVLPTSSSFPSQPGQFRVVLYQSTSETPGPNWVLICVTFTDAGQQVIRWQAGSVVLPIPDSGQQIQWGSNALQLGRGANKLSLDGGTGNAIIPGTLTTTETWTTTGGANPYGRYVGPNSQHAVILRGDASGTGGAYSVTPGGFTTFVEFGGTWRFRQVTASTNELMLEINTSNVLYKNIALQRIPYVSCRVDGTNVNNRGGQVVPTADTSQSGRTILTISPPHPAGGLFNPQVTLITNWGYVYVDSPVNGGGLTVWTANSSLGLAHLSFFLLIF